MKEQYERFCEALATAGTGTNSTNCEVCPIRTECEAFSATLSPVDDCDKDIVIECVWSAENGETMLEF